MRISFALAASIAGAVLFTVTACQSESSTGPVKGTVVEKEHEAAKPATTSKNCSRVRQSNGTYKQVCVTHTKSPAKPECYELEIRTEDGKEVEICDEVAFSRLNVGDPYDSSQNYGGEES